jgi:thiamine kinase-like enzyme
MKPSEINQISKGWLSQTHPKSFYIELEIKEKKRTIQFWNEKILVAEYHKKKNEQKIADLVRKLQDSKNLEDSQK